MSGRQQVDRRNTDTLQGSPHTLKPQLDWNQQPINMSAITFDLLPRSILREHAADLILHPISWVPRQMLPLHSSLFPSSMDRLFAILLGLWWAAQTGQRGCKTLPGGECIQVFKVFQCKFRVPALFTEPISGTVVEKGLHCQGPGARVKTRSVLWSLVPLR